MLIMNPLTINTDIANVNFASSVLPFLNTVTKLNLNVLTSDSVNISSIGIERLHKDNGAKTTKDIEQTSNEAVSVTSTIGQNKSANNLNHAQAKELYIKISSLL